MRAAHDAQTDHPGLRHFLDVCENAEELPPEDDQQRAHDKGNAEGEHHRDEVAVDDALALARAVILAHEG